MSAFYDHKAAFHFAEALHGFPNVRPVSADVSDDQSHVEITVALTDLHDFETRDRLMELASQLGQEYHVTVLIFFRNVDEVADFVTH